MGNLGFVLSEIDFITVIVPCPLNRLNYLLTFSTQLHLFPPAKNSLARTSKFAFMAFTYFLHILKFWSLNCILTKHSISKVHGMSVLMVEIPS